MTTPAVAAPAALVDGLLAAWREPVPARRLERLAEVCAPDVRYRDPLGAADGIDELVRCLGAFRNGYPGHRLRRTSDVDSHHDVLRFGWTVHDRSGTAVLWGEDVAWLDGDGRFAVVTAFAGPLPSRTYSLRY